MAESSPAIFFHQFSRLPPELRERIWFFCLPRRVVPLDDFLWLVDADSTYRGEQQCWAGWRLVQARAKAPPFLASVCREARRVAFRWGDIEHIYPSASLDDIWIQRKLDTPLLTWMLSDSAGAGHGEDMMEHFLFDQRWHHAGAPVCLTAEQFFAFDPRPSAPESKYTPCIRTDESDSIVYLLRNTWTEGYTDELKPDMSDAMDVSVVMETVYIHATRADVLASELFGLIADEPSQLVNYDDAATLAKFRALFNKNPENRKRVALREKFDAVESHEFPGHVARWLSKVAWKLLAIKWLDEKQHNPQSSVYRDSMQVFDRPFSAGDILLMETISEGKNSFRSDHPWVVEETKALPKLKPKIWFTYCTRNCKIETKAKVF